MTTATGIESTAIRAVTPFICVPEGDKFIEFAQRAFGAEVTARHPHHGHDGFVAGVKIGDSDLLVMGGESLRGQEFPATLHVFVRDCDAAYRRALDAGAATLGSVGEPANRPYGERAAFVSDPFGNIWFIATRLEGDYVGPGLRNVTPCLLSPDARPLMGFLERAFDAKVEGVHEEGGHLMHAFVRVGEIMLEMAESAPGGARPHSFYLHVEDVDAVYSNAVAAGASSVAPPADQPFGDRLAIVEDPAKNRWLVAKRISAA